MSEYTQSGIISFQQKQSFDYHISLTDSNHYEILLLDLDVTNLKFDLVGLAINRLFEENDSLRTIFTQVKRETFQNVLIFKPDINYYDLVSKVNTHYNDAEVDRMLSKMRSEMGFSEKTLLARCALVQFKYNVVRCIFFIHHIIADLWSVLIVKKEFHNIYKNLTDGLNTYTLPAVKKYNMIDYAIEQKVAFDRNKSSVISYWQKKLTPVLTNEQAGVINLLGQKDERSNLIVSSINQRLDSGACGFIVSKIEDKLYSSIYKILKESNTGFMALFNLLFSLLPSYSKVNRHVLIASPVNNRLSSNLKSAIGLCGGSIYTCLDINFELNISQLLKQAYIDILKSFKHAITEHQIFQLDGRCLRERTDLFLNITSNDLENKIPDHYHTHPKEAFEGKRVYYKLQCSVHEQSDHICLIWGFNNEFYTKGQVETMINTLFNLIEIFESGLETPLSTSLDLVNSLT